jgi:hypothetical protein
LIPPPKLTDIYSADKQGHYLRTGAEGERAALSVSQDKHLVADSIGVKARRPQILTHNLYWYDCQL